MIETTSNKKYEYLDHTADVQIRAWGQNLKEAFENAAIAMTDYITEIDKIDISQSETIVVEACDLEELLFRFLDAVLFLFNADPYLLSKRVNISNFIMPMQDQVLSGDETELRYKIEAECSGELFVMGKHPQGTEIKAITYSNMKVTNDDGKHEVLFIVDI